MNTMSRGPDPTALAALICDWCLEVTPDAKVMVSSTTLAAGPPQGVAQGAANVDGRTLPDYVARSFEAGIRPRPGGPFSVGTLASASRRVFAFSGRLSKTRELGP